MHDIPWLLLPIGIISIIVSNLVAERNPSRAQRLKDDNPTERMRQPILLVVCILVLLAPAALITDSHVVATAQSSSSGLLVLGDTNTYFLKTAIEGSQYVTFQPTGDESEPITVSASDVHFSYGSPTTYLEVISYSPQGLARLVSFPQTQVEYVLHLTS